MWSVESLPAAIYLKGERETIYGINKTLIVCGDKKLLLWFIFDPQGRADEVMQMNATSVLIDGEPMPIRGSEKQARNGWINTTIALDADLLSRVRAAKTIGVAHQWAHGAPIFLGFDGMPFAGGAARLDGILNVCH
jgi:hypothetical protein